MKVEFDEVKEKIAGMERNQNEIKVGQLRQGRNWKIALQPSDKIVLF